MLTVPDQALREVAEELGGLLGDVPQEEASPPFVAHTSGATSVTVLAPCEEAGAQTLVLHPLQTFPDPRMGADRFRGVAMAVTPGSDGPDSPAARFGFDLARTLGARPFFLPDDKRTLYHAAATLACNYFVTIEHEAERLFHQAGLPQDEALEMFLPLVKTTLENIFTQGTVRALTGPLSRGDLETVRAHLSALETEAPQTVPLYRALGLATLDILRLRGELDEKTISALAELLGASGPQRGKQPRPRRAT